MLADRGVLEDPHARGGQEDVFPYKEEDTEPVTLQTPSLQSLAGAHGIACASVWGALWCSSFRSALSSLLGALSMQFLSC